MDNVQQLQQKVAHLESYADQLETEIAVLNDLLMGCGFPNGVQSLKEVIQDLFLEADFNE